MNSFVIPDLRFVNLKIAFVVNTLACGGAEKALLSLLGHFDTYLFQPLVVCLGSLAELGEDLLSKGTTTIYWGLGDSRFGPRRLFRLLKILRKESVDLICDAITQAQTQVLVAIAKKRLRVPAVCWVHNTGRVSPRFHQELIARISLPRYNRIITVGSSQRNELCRAYHLDSEKVVTVHNGIPFEPFDNIPSPGNAKTTLGIEPSRSVIGITAQLRPEKHHENLLAAIRIITSHIPNVLLLIVGDGPRRTHLEQVSENLGISKNVRFLGKRDNIPDIVAAYDVGVLSSLPVVETLPLAVLEYMAAAKPTVATNVGSLSDIVFENKTGFLVPPQDPIALAGKIIKLLKEPYLAIDMGRQAATIVRQRFSVQSMVSGLESCFREVTVKRKPL